MIQTWLYFSPFYIDRGYLFLVLPAMLLAMGAQYYVSSCYRKFGQIRNQRGITGRIAAERILRGHGLHQIGIRAIAGALTDNYDPRHQTLSLSEGVYNGDSIAAVAVAAHEAGHAIQFSQNYFPGRLRSAIFPLAQIGSFAGPYLAIFGLILQSQLLFKIGIVLFGAAVAFYLITLPVEFDASLRALRVISDEGMLSEEELKGARTMLRAAALTYIASATVAFANLLRLILLSRSRDER